MRKWSLLILMGAVAVGCATAPSPSPEYSPAERRIAERLLHQRLPQFVERRERAALRVAGHPKDEHLAVDQRLRQRVETQLAPEAVVSDVVRLVARSFDERAVAELEAFDASLTGCQVRIGSGAFYSRFSRLGYRLFGVPNGESPERIALVERLDALTYARPTTVDLYMRVYEAMVRWYQGKGFVDLEESDAVGGIGSLLARERARVEAIGAQHTVPFMRYAFSRLSTQELAQYVAQVEAPAGQWYAKAVREALIETIDRRSQAIER